MARLPPSKFTRRPSSPSNAAPPPRSTIARCTRGRIGGLGVKNFADGTDACLIQVRDETFQKLPCRRQFLGVQSQISIDIGPDQQGPDRTLVVGGVARSQVAVVFRFVVRVAWRQGP